MGSAQVFDATYSGTLSVPSEVSSGRVSGTFTVAETSGNVSRRLYVKVQRRKRMVTGWEDVYSETFPGIRGKKQDTFSFSTSDGTERLRLLMWWGFGGDKRVKLDSATVDVDTSTSTQTSETPDPANIVVTDLTASPKDPEEGETVTLTATVTNKGGQSGVRTVRVMSNGWSVGSFNVRLDPGETVKRTVEDVKEKIGSRDYTVDGKRTSVDTTTTDKTPTTDPTSGSDSTGTDRNTDSETPPRDGMGPGPDGQQDSTDTPAEPTTGTINQNGSESSFGP